MEGSVINFTNVPKEYDGLADVLADALEQAAFGKGAERHTNGAEFFEDQVCCEGARRFGEGAPMFQAWKKIDEASRMEPEPAIRELLGAINYCATAIIKLQEDIEDKVLEEVDEIADANPEVSLQEAVDMLDIKKFVAKLFGVPEDNISIKAVDSDDEPTFKEEHVCAGCGKCEDAALEEMAAAKAKLFMPQQNQCRCQSA